MSAGPVSRGKGRAHGVTRALSILLLTLAAGLVIAACGGDDEQLSREEYEQELEGTRQQIDGAFGDASEELRGVGDGSASLDSAAQRLEEARGRLDEAADELDAVEPPEDATDAHDRLVEGVRELSGEFGQFGDALESGSVPRVQQFVRDFRDLDSVEKIERAIADLEEQGYRVDGGR